ncbi:11881_t:CDS:2, partial [Racocetra fulgida]
MNFTEPHNQSLNLCRFSPDLKYIATAIENIIVIRNAETLQVSREFKHSTLIQCIEWSPNSSLILAANLKKGDIVVHDINDPTWKKTIKEGPAGLLNVKWNLDGKSIMCFSDFEDPPWFILAERRECKDFIGVYKCDTDDWKLLN